MSGVGDAPASRRPVVLRVATAIVGGIAALELALWLVRPAGGLAGFIQIAAPHLAIAGLALGPLALARSARALRVALVVLLVVTVGRFAHEWLSLPLLDPPAERLTLTTWSLEIGPAAAGATVAGLREQNADVVILQELNPTVARAITEDAVLAERYPERFIGAGLGTLSRFPIVATHEELGSALQDIVIAAEDRVIRILNGHPVPGLLGREVPGALTPYDPSRRDAILAMIRRIADDRIAAGELVIVAGDFNTAPVEPGFERLAAGLQDAHAEVGIGPGWTWRPSRLLWLPFGLLRLDVVLTGPGLTPVASTIRCQSDSEHCLVTVEIGVKPPG